MKTTLSLITALFISSLTSAQTTVSLPANRDVSIAYHGTCPTEDNNYVDAPQLAAWMIPGHSSCGGFNNNQGVFDFQMDTIPSDAIIQSASLNLYAYYNGNFPVEDGHVGDANDSYIERVLEPWDENTITWNNRPNATTTGAAYLESSTDSQQDYLDIDVTEMVQQMILSPDSANGFLLRLVSEETYNILSFCSKDNGDESKIPTLTITYEVPLSIDNNTSNSTVQIMPNPAIEQLNIQSNEIIKAYTIRNIAGKTIESTSYSSNSIEIANLQPGVYFLTVITEQGEITKKFVKR